MTFSVKSRQEEINRLKNGEKVDLVIIGGGITGAGVALQASAAGMKTVLVEMQDFGEGTSSRSTRLVHGGIRYLKTFDVKVVSDTTNERAVVQHISPHTTYPDPMILPIYDEPGTTFDMFSVKVAMDLYDHLAKINETPSLKKYANYTLSKDEVLEREPQLAADKLVGAGVYLDYQNNDSRLVVENIKRAHDDGGIMLSQFKATEIIHDEHDKVIGIKAIDNLTGDEITIHANVVLNASGPWSDKVRGLDDKATNLDLMRPTKGVHLVVDKSRLSVPQPTYFGSGTNDGRMIFVIPREGKTYFGTTDTDYKGDYEDPKVEQSDVDYLLRIINKKYPTANLTIDDIETAWAGIRPLIKSPEEETEADATSGASQAKSDAPSAVSRGSELMVADDGLITIAGGKLTDYRLMAEGAMKKIREVLKNDFGRDFDEIDSKEIKVSGGDFESEHVEEEEQRIAEEGQIKGLSYEDSLYLAKEYGSNAPIVYDYVGKVDAAPGLSLLETIRIHYGVDYEMVINATDHMMRRTYDALFHMDELVKTKDAIIALLADLLGWDDEEIAKQKAAVDDMIAETTISDLKK